MRTTSARRDRDDERDGGEPDITAEQARRFLAEARLAQARAAEPGFYGRTSTRRGLRKRRAR